MISQRIFGIALALLALASPSAPAQEPDAALAEAIRSFDPGATLSLDPALVHAADFNGDGRQDVAAVLEGGGKSALVIFNRTPSGYRAYVLYAALPQGPLQLRVVPPGRHRILGPEGTVEVASPALELVFPGRASAMYAWGEGRYLVYGTENY
ncbi:MAG TPA: hypothetical protein VEY33_07985 [Gemmatimonadota bacterium]|nr:hypothetical protein [Gemmatimonadota bacterium]